MSKTPKEAKDALNHFKQQAKEELKGSIQFYCLPQDYECPYYKNGFCQLKDPMPECDDYASLVEEYED